MVAEKSSKCSVFICNLHVDRDGIDRSVQNICHLTQHLVILNNKKQKNKDCVLSQKIDNLNGNHLNQLVDDGGNLLYSFGQAA